MLATSLEIHGPELRRQPDGVGLPRQRAGLEFPSLEHVLSAGALRRIEAKEHLFAEGDRKAFVYHVVSGAICLYKVLADGRRQVIDFALPGDFVGLAAGSFETLNAQATVSTRVRCVPESLLRSTTQSDGRLALRLYEALSLQLSSMRDHLIALGQRSAMERLVGFLLMLSERNAAKGREPDVIELPMTRTDIGDFLGLTIETVSRTFTKLRARGLIAIEHGTGIHITSLEALRAMVEDES